MPPRKKRPVKPLATAARQTRSGVIYQPVLHITKPNSSKKAPDDKKEKTSVPSLTTKRVIEPMVTRSHKKFGKFRYLLDKSDDSSKKSPKKVDSEVVESSPNSDSPDDLANSKPSATGSVEISTYPDNVSNDSNDMIERQENEGALNKAEINLIVSGEKHCSVVVQDILDAEMEYTEDIQVPEDGAIEIAEQLSNLNVDSSITVHNEPDSNIINDSIVSNVEVEYVDCAENVENDQEIFDVDHLQSDIDFECISEEVIPIGEEQEVVELIDSNEGDCDIIPVDVILEETKDDSLDNEGNVENSSDKEDISNKVESKEVIIIEEESESKISIEEDVNTNDIGPKETVTNENKTKRNVTKLKTEKKTPPKIQKSPSAKVTCSENSVRRSSRIKSISVLKQKSKGRGLVKHKKEKEISPKSTETDTSDNSNSGHGDSDKLTTSSDSIFVIPATDTDQKPVKVKSRWRRSSELEMVNCSPSVSNRSSPQNNSESCHNVVSSSSLSNEKLGASNEEVEKRLKQFVHLKENQYLTERVSCKEAKKMTCDCFLTREEIETGEYGCGEDCLNRLLMIECGNLCAVGERCTNKRFQKSQFAPCEAFQTDRKGLGIRASANIPYGEFILEYIGEVLDPDEFDNRATEYSKDKNRHYYFMALRADAVIDATQKGNISRFINHSCDPNAETQKWTVNGELRIGFFSKRTILAGEEITFDYQFQRYGKEAQKCFCEAATCRGWLGEEPDDYEDDDDEEDDDEEEGEEDTEESVKIEKVEEVNAIEPVVDISPKKEGIEEEIIVKVETPIKKEKRRIVKPRKPRKDMFEDIDPLDDEIESLQTTGLKNQAHTLKLSRLVVRAKEPPQRTKLLRILRHGELPCRRLFLDYHGLRLIHGWMTDAQQMARVDEKLKSLKLEILQTLATLPIPNKTMLQDSKVLPTVEKWSVGDECSDGSPIDCESNSPKIETTSSTKDIETELKTSKIIISHTTFKNKEESAYKSLESKDNYQEDMDISPLGTDEKDSIIEVKSITVPEAKPLLPDYDTEIIALAVKLLEEWSVLKEVFRIPKKERIEQMKEHEREADRKYRAGLGSEQDHFRDRHSEHWYRRSKRNIRKEQLRLRSKDRQSSFDKYERRRMFAMQIEFEEAERRRKQQEMWRQHEQRCIVMGTDPRFTAPYDPSQGYQCIWNPQTGQWQNFPLPSNHNVSFGSQHGQKSNQHLIINHLQPMTSQASSNQSFSSNPHLSHSNVNLSVNQHLSVGQLIPLNQPPPIVSSSHLSQGHHLAHQILTTNSQLIPHQHLPAHKNLSSNQHISLNQHIHSNQNLTHHQQVSNLQSPHSKNQPNLQLLSNQLTQHLSLNQQYVSNIPVPPNVTVLPNLGIPPNLNMRQNHNISSSINLPPNINVPTNLNLPPNLSLPPNINLPPNLNLSGLNLGPNFNISPNQQMLSHNSQTHQQLLQPNQSASTGHHMLSIQQMQTSQSVQHLSSNNNFTFTGNVIHTSAPPLPTSSPTKVPPSLPALPYEDIIKEKEEEMQWTVWHFCW